MSIDVDAQRLSTTTRVSTYVALCSTQGNRTVYSIRVPLGDLEAILPRPDPEWVDVDNRKVSVRHARDFGFYLTGVTSDFHLRHERGAPWVAPALLARDCGVCTFEPVDGGEGAVGYLHVPWARSGEQGRLSIIDGQHRVLGVYLEFERLTNRIYTLDRNLGVAKSAQRVARITAQREAISERVTSMQHQHIGLDIYVEPDVPRSRQMFVDIADNARGISAAVRSRFDSSKVVNRTLDDIMEHPLLAGRVDLEQDRMTATNPHLLGAKHVADMVKALLVGVSGRIGKSRERELVDNTVVEVAHRFLNVLTGAFTDLAAVAEGILEPAVLRRKSLLGSVGMLRVLAGVYHNLIDEGIDDETITEFFRFVDTHMAAPVAENSLWRTSADTAQCFEYGAVSPIMRIQNLSYLATTLTSWYYHRRAQLEN